MARPIPLNKLTDTLIRLYPKEDESRMVVQRAGIDGSNIEFSTAASVNWTNIVGEALRRDALVALVDTVVQMRPDVSDELRAHLRNYQKWAERHASTPDEIETVAAQPLPRWLMRMRKSIASWSGFALACFAAIGVLARESRHLFLGLPGSHYADLLDSPRTCATEGGVFLLQTAGALFDYAGFNPLGVLAIVAAGVAAFWFRRRLSRSLRYVWTPAVVVPLLLVAALAKMYWYDVPAFHYEQVLSTRNWADPSLLDVAPPLTHVTQERWRAVICSRVANQATPAVEKVCGQSPNHVHEQNILGMYVLDVFLTIVICATGIAALRKLLFTSQRRDWNLRPSLKYLGATLLVASLLLALLPVPWTWSRTVRPTRYPMYRSDARRIFRICADKTECYSYQPGRKPEHAGALPPTGRVEDDDVLQRKFEYDLSRPVVELPERGPRFSLP